MVEPSPEPELEPRLARGIRTALWGSEQLLCVIAGRLLHTLPFVVLLAVSPYQVRRSRTVGDDPAGIATEPV